MPWREQVRPGGRCLRWLFWPADTAAWANTVRLILWATMTLAISYQLWLPLLAAFALGVLVDHLGHRRPPGGR